MIKSIECKNFTVFENIKVEFSEGINIFIGENGTGKTHLMKLLYAACEIVKSKKDLVKKIVDVFMPVDGQINRLARRKPGNFRSSVRIVRKKSENNQDVSLDLEFSNKGLQVKGLEGWYNDSFFSLYIPVKDMMANTPGFRSLYNNREIAFEEVYYDIIDKAFIPPKRGRISEERQRLLDIIQQAISGKVVQENEIFYLKNEEGELEFSLLAEGWRKLGLLWLLIQNDTLTKGSVLFWDEPETNLNPKLLMVAVQILLELQKMGVQIFIATHSYFVLKLFDIMGNTAPISYYSFYKDKSSITYSQAKTLNNLSVNILENIQEEIFDLEIKKDIEKIKKKG